MSTTINVPLLRQCARCGEDHEHLAFTEIDRPIETGVDPPFRFWCACPTNGQPILMRQAAKWEENYASAQKDPHYLAPEEYRSITLRKWPNLGQADEDGAKSG